MRALLSGFAIICALGVQGCGDDVETLDASIASYIRDNPEYSDMQGALGRAGLLDALNREGDYTLFLVNNTQYASILAEYAPSEEAELDWAQYHVAQGAWSAGDLKRRTALESFGPGEIHVRNIIEGLSLNEGVFIEGEGVELDNGWVHTLDTPLIRPLVTETLRFRSEPDLELASQDEEGFRLSEDSIIVTQEGFVHDLKLGLHIEHPNVSNLVVTLRHENVRGNVLAFRANSRVANINTVLADGASVDLVTDAPVGDASFNAASYSPVMPFETLVGAPSQGEWLLTVFELGQRVDARLVSWDLSLTVGAERPEATFVFLEGPALGATWGRGFTERSQVDITRAGGNALDNTEAPGTLDTGYDVELIAEGFASSRLSVADDESQATLATAVPAAAEIGPTEVSVLAKDDAGTSRILTFGVNVVQPDSQGVELLAQLPLTELGAPTGRGNDIWGWTDPMTGAEIAIMGTSDGTAFVDITEPTRPTVLGTLATHTESSGWRDIKVHRNFAYIVSEAEGHGMQVFDLTQLRSLDGFTELSETHHVDDFGQAHNVVINEESGFAYVVGSRSLATCMGGLRMYDLLIPASPRFVGCFAGGVPAGKDAGPDYPTNVYIHDAQCVIYNGPDADYAGRELCLTSDERSVGIVDVTNKTSPVQVSRFSYGSVGYTHQGWLTEDQAYFLVNDEFDEADDAHDTRTYVFDVSNLDAPVQVGAMDNPRDAVGHNFYVLGQQLFQANYTSGLRILDLSRVANAFSLELAYFDTYPDDDIRDHRRSACSSESCADAIYQGAWSTYPYFASGNIVVSDIDRGLFVLRQE